MAQELTIQAKKIIQTTQTNVLADFSIDSVLCEFEERARVNYVELLSFSAITADAATALKTAKQLSVEIPTEFLDGLKKGDLHFDNSQRIAGNLTPNIRDAEGKIVGQATLKQGVNPRAITVALSNVAVFAMMYQISSKLDKISEQLDVIKQGQENDRVATVISGFKDFHRAYMANPQNPDEIIIKNAYSKMTDALNKLHFSIDSDYHLDKNGRIKKFRWAPDNMFKSILYTHIFTERYRKQFLELQQRLVVFQQMETLTEIVGAFCLGISAANNLHQEASALYDRLLTQKFRDRMYFLMDPKGSKEEFFLNDLVEMNEERGQKLKSLLATEDSQSITRIAIEAPEIKAENYGI